MLEVAPFGQPLYFCRRGWAPPPLQGATKYQPMNRFFYIHRVVRRDIKPTVCFFLSTVSFAWGWCGSPQPISEKATEKKKWAVLMYRRMSLDFDPVPKDANAERFARSTIQQPPSCATIRRISGNVCSWWRHYPVCGQCHLCSYKLLCLMCMPRSAQDFSMGCDYDIYYLVAKTIFGARYCTGLLML